MKNVEDIFLVSCFVSMVTTERIHSLAKDDDEYEDEYDDQCDDEYDDECSDEYDE